jgi:enoyl-CoA hydratase/carnithine racemase
MSPPKTYSDLPLKEVRVSNHPANAPGVTPIQIVTLYRPNAYNAFTRVMQEELVLLWNTFDADDRVKVIIMTGHGKMFCAGADLQQGFKRDMSGKVNDHRDGFVPHR